ncbi:MAG: methyltransferase domain-containing protein [Deltaproteobacteria bacterium]|nr:methyltransferase domain-containing protein [Deltaproteobacteria bacterium]
MSETIHRFDDRVQDYLQGRPGYPAGIIPVLEAQVGLQPGWTVVDIGAGTGLLSRVFLDAGCRVVGVEPSPQMAEAGRLALADAPGFRMVEGQAEATGLDDEVAELVVAAQAFHWFDPDAAAEGSNASCGRPGRWRSSGTGDRRPAARSRRPTRPSSRLGASTMARCRSATRIPRRWPGSSRAGPRSRCLCPTCTGKTGPGCRRDCGLRPTCRAASTCGTPR